MVGDGALERRVITSKVIEFYSPILSLSIGLKGRLKYIVYDTLSDP